MRESGSAVSDAFHFRPAGIEKIKIDSLGSICTITVGQADRTLDAHIFAHSSSRLADLEQAPFRTGGLGAAESPQA